MMDTAAEMVGAADALLITAGAGMGVDSGLPDFRGKEGFWRAYPAIAKLGLRFEEMANPAWFGRSPELAWAFYGHRYNLYRRTEPHEGFTRLLQIAKAKRDGYFVFTSNVDGHFQKAGFDPERVAECHGSIHHRQCAGPCTAGIWEADGQEIRIAEPEFKAVPPLPQCRACGGMARPNVLMFGDGRWIASRSAAQQRRFQSWLTEIRAKRGRLAIIELGAGTAVPTVRMTSEAVAEAFQATLIRINPRESEGPEGTISVAAGALEGIRGLCAALSSFQDCNAKGLEQELS